jgi:hypothetical protein
MLCLVVVVVVVLASSGTLHEKQAAFNADVGDIHMFTRYSCTVSTVYHGGTSACHTFYSCLRSLELSQRWHVAPVKRFGLVTPTDGTGIVPLNIL